MKLRTQLFLGYALVFLLMILMAVVSVTSSRRLLDTHQRLRQTHEIIGTGRLVERAIVDLQTAKRGFLIFGTDEYLQPYEEGRRVYEREMARLKSYVGHDRRQTQRLEEIELLVDRWFATSAVPEIEERRRIAFGEITAPPSWEVEGFADPGRPIFVEIRRIFDDFSEAEYHRLDANEAAAVRASRIGLAMEIGFTSLAVMVGLSAGYYITRSVLRQVGGEPAEIASVTGQIARGNLDIDVEGGTGIKASVGSMVHALRENRQQTVRQDWLKTGIAQLSRAVSGGPDINTLESRAISEIAARLDAPLAALYVADAGFLTLQGSYACPPGEHLPRRFKLGEGLVGQAAVEQQPILLDSIPEDYIKVTSALGGRTPRFLCITPLLHEGSVKGVAEIAALDPFAEQHIEYLRQAMPILAVAVESAQSRRRLADSLEESQRLTEELQVQQEELRAANEELEQQAQRLKDSSEKLRMQQEELEVTNEELEMKNQLLEQQKQQVETARKDIAATAEELALASKYKSEFLANMSHELRTPLNSLLLLSQDLARNKDGNLTPQQVEAAKIVYSSGSDLLNLINEVLDLAKIESGRMDVNVARVPISDLADSVRASFTHVAAQKGLRLDVAVEDNAPADIRTDRKRLEQVLRNLLSNAIKFTESGRVSVSFARPSPETDLSRSKLSPDQCISIAVADTGIGIAPDKQKVIFEAFQQVDGGTARKYGGTGLGLSISRELVALLGGQMHVRSDPGKGSTFTVYLPLAAAAPAADTNAARTPGVQTSPPPQPVRQHPAPPPQAKDDRDSIEKGDRVVLIVEDDARFAGLLAGKCHDKGFKSLIAYTGAAALELAAKHLPSAVILDIRLPDTDGIAVLHRLKENTRTRHIPVHVVSVEERSAEALRSGAVGHAVKPLDRDSLEGVFHRLEKAFEGAPKRVLVIEDDAAVRREIVKMIGNGDVTAEEAAAGKDAMEMLRKGGYHCVVLDLMLPDMNGYELLTALKREGVDLPPVIIHTVRDLTPEEELAMREHAESIVIKDVRSQERLLDEVSLFLHRIVDKMPDKTRRIIQDLHDTDALLKNKKVLIVDDDMRTTFALSHLLSEAGMVTLKAENGERALKLLQENPDVDIVLVDIMMPVMDGYETMKRIRRQQDYRKLPIIVLTAKAMPEDRAKCLEAGANDYLPKPIDRQRLLSMLRVWLIR